MGLLDDRALRHDRLSVAARQSVAIGDRTLLAISDGFIRIPPTFAGTPAQPTAVYDALHAEMGEVRMPLGCCYLPGERNALVDAGYGPADYEGRDFMVGGRLLQGLEEEGVRSDDVDVLMLSHLHADHIGWVADERGEPTFRRATVHVGRADWEHFMEAGSEPAPQPHVVEGLRRLAAEGRVELLDGEVEVIPGLRRVPAPGHTPGHSVYVVHDGRDRVLLLGDAVYCPQQLTELEWATAFDVDPVAAAQTRQALARDLEDSGGLGLGCHFPGLVAGRVLSGPRP